jgi:hypothetical protein
VSLVSAANDAGCSLTTTMKCRGSSHNKGGQSRLCENQGLAPRKERKVRKLRYTRMYGRNILLVD